MMGLMSIKTLAAAVLASSKLAISGGMATAGTTTVYCPGSDPIPEDGLGYREFSVTSDPAASCLAFGVGNLNGSNMDGFLDLVGLASDDPDSPYYGYVVIDKSDAPEVGIAGYNGLSGNIGGEDLLTGTINLLFPTIAQAPSGWEYYDFAIGFKTGEGSFDPDWAVFALAPGVTSLTWTVSSQVLFHSMLYAKLRVSEVPLPASLPLLLGGIGLLGFVGRRRKATTG
jgi:hypothetical protein